MAIVNLYYEGGPPNTICFIQNDLQRSRKSCRLRWVNYLRPGLKHGDFTGEEVEIILDLHRKLGNRWSVIASRLPERTDNEIKNYWHTHLSRRLKHDLMPESESFRIPFVETEPKSSSEIVLPPADAPKASNAETAMEANNLLVCSFICRAFAYWT